MLVQVHHTRVIVLWPLLRRDSLKRLMQVRLLSLRQYSYYKRVSQCLVELTPVDAFLPLCGNAKGNIFEKSVFNSLLSLLVLVALEDFLA